MVEQQQIKNQVEKRESSSLIIVRKEYGYAGIYGIGVTKDREIFFIYDNTINLPLGEGVRLIENPPVENALSSPIKVFLDPSLACPLNCPFCLSGVSEAKERKQRIPSIPKKEIEQINKQLIQAGVLQVKIGGGEPFIYPHFWDTLIQLGSAGIILSTSTSGITLNDPTLLPKDKIEILRKYGVKISISVDGEPTYHNRIRGKDNLLQTALLGRLRLLEEGIKPAKIELRATITNTLESMTQIEYLNRLSQELNTRLRIRLALPSGSATVNGVAVIYPSRQFWSFYNELRQYAEDNPLIHVEEIVRFDKPPYLKTALYCGAGTRSAFIDVHGNFMPCGFIDEHFPVPPHNLFTEGKSILELWQRGKAFTAVRSYLKEENEKNPCGKCGFVHSCQGGCPAIRLSAHTKSDPRCPKEKQVYIPIEVNIDGECRRITFANLTTGSLLLYQPPETQEPYVVFTGEIDDGKLILKTPGGKMNGEMDKTLSDTSRREIKEELEIDESELQPIPVEKTQLIVNSDRKGLEKVDFTFLNDHLDCREIPLAIIIEDNALIIVYNYMTSKKPVPTSDSPFVILIPQSCLSAIPNIKTLEDLNKIGAIFTQDSIDLSLPVLPVGTAAQIVKIINKNSYVGGK